MLRRQLRVALFSSFLVLQYLPASASGASTAGPVAYRPGSILIKTSEHRLYLVLEDGGTISYPLAVGRQGRKWEGKAFVTRKVLKPAWAPPPVIRRDNPRLPKVIPPGPRNPLGAAVLVLGDGTYGIHGTNRDNTIGKDASYGCFRMHNKDVLDLFSRVPVGAPVYVTR
ncbi:MAG: L,D-transpeptidase [Parvibaculaceae bacterium]